MAIDLEKIIKADKGNKDRKPISELVGNPNKVQEFISTGIITVDLGLSGKPNGGIPIGKMSMIPGPSKMGKTMLSMAVAKRAQKRGMSVVIIDTEAAYSENMAVGFGLDISPDKLTLLACPDVNSIEVIKGALLTIANAIPIKERENLLVIIDSWGAFVSTKTINDALTGNSAADMTEAKMQNNLAKVLLSTGFTTLILNHIYTNTGVSFGEPFKISGGTKVYLMCSSILMGMSRSKDKNDEKDVTGSIMKCKTHKGRFAIENKEIEYRINNEGGLDMFYGLLPYALEHGVVQKVKDGRANKLVRSCIENDVPRD